MVFVGLCASNMSRQFHEHCFKNENSVTSPSPALSLTPYRLGGTLVVLGSQAQAVIYIFGVCSFISKVVFFSPSNGKRLKTSTEMNIY